MTTTEPQYSNVLRLTQGTENTSISAHTVSVDNELVNVFTLAERFNVHYRTAQRWTKNNWIPHYRVGKSIRYKLSEVLSAIAHRVR